MPAATKKFWSNPIRTLILIWLAASLVLSLLGPFGSFPTLSLSERIVYWGSVVGSAIVLITALRIMAVQLIGPKLRPLQMDAILVPIFTILYTPPLQYFTADAARELQPFDVLQTGLIVIAVSIVLIAIREALRLNAPGVDIPDQGDTDQTATEDAEKQLIPILFERLPQDAQDELWAISGSDHYVEVRTNRATTSILLRFSDALREIEGVPGLRVHRSHWVAVTAVASMRRDGHRQFVVLHNGDELPVSRTYAKNAFDLWGDPAEFPISQ